MNGSASKPPGIHFRRWNNPELDSAKYALGKLGLALQKTGNLGSIPKSKPEVKNLKFSIMKSLFKSASWKQLTALLEEKATETGNRGFAYTALDQDFLQQFGNVSEHSMPFLKWRTSASVCRALLHKAGGFNDAAIAERDVEETLRLVAFIRAVTRTPIGEGTKYGPLKGQGSISLANFRLYNLLKKVGSLRNKASHLLAFYASIIGRIGDLNQIAILAAVDGKKESKDIFDAVVEAYAILLGSEVFSDLAKKYLPQIRGKAANRSFIRTVKSQLGRHIADALNLSPKAYRRLKSSGTAHQWQKCISKGKFDDIDFAKVHGRALLQMERWKKGQWLVNHKISDMYARFIEQAESVPFTGYPFEALAGVHEDSPNYKKVAANRRFETLLQKYKDGGKVKRRFLGVRDVSGSMTSPSVSMGGRTYSALQIATALCLTMAHLNEGEFHGCFVDFSDTSKLRQMKAEPPANQYLWALRIVNSMNTNFVGVADLFVSLLKRGVPLSTFPDGIVCFSDGEFDHTGNYTTAAEAFLQRLQDGGFPEEYVQQFQIILWDIRSSYYQDNTRKYQSLKATDSQIVHLSGMDGGLVQMVLGMEVEEKENRSKTIDIEELCQQALHQEAINEMVKIIG